MEGFRRAYGGYPPGGRSAEHRHPGFIVGYVVEGQIRFAINNEAPRVLRAGEMFYEPAGSVSVSLPSVFCHSRSQRQTSPISPKLRSEICALG